MNRFRHVLQMLVFAALALAVTAGLQPADVCAYEEAKPLPQLMGNYRDDFLSVALSQEGYTADKDNGTVYWNWAGARGKTKAWCSEFTAWCANSAKIPEEIIPVKWSSGGYREFFAEQGSFYTVTGGCADSGCKKCSKYAASSISPYEIRSGDILIVESNGDYSDGPDHTCIAWKIEGDTLYTIDGNVNNKDSGSRSVKIRKKDLKEKVAVIHGVCRPLYPDYNIAKAVVRGIRAKTWTGRALTQRPVVKVGGMTLKKDTDYTVDYKNNKNVGRATVTITGIGNGRGKITKSFRIDPKGTAVTGLTRAKKAVTVKWKKQAGKMSAARVTGYQIQLAENRKFTRHKKLVKVKGYSRRSKKIRKLRGGKKYYVRIRTYRKVGRLCYYSAWSKVRSVKTKK